MKVSNQIVTLMVRNGIVKDEERDIYSYGIEQIIFNGINIITLALIGILSHSLITVIVFTLVYMILRVYAGGYHAETQLKCFVLSNLMILTVIGADIIIPMSSVVQIVIVLISSAFILILGPVDTITKRFDKVEYSVYRKKMMIILVMECIVFITLIMINQLYFSKIIALALVAVVIMLLSGVFDNISKKEVS